MKKLLVLATSILLMAAIGPTRQDAPAAVIVKVEGTVQVQVGGGDPQAAAVGVRLSVGDRILPGTDSRAIVVYQTGSTSQVTEATTIEAASAGSNDDMFARTVGVLAQAASSDARTQPNRQGMIRPVPGAPEIISPRNAITVLSTRPSFSWHPGQGDAEYRIQIRAEGSPPVRFEVGATTEWALPEDAEALVPGQTYWWTVGPAGRGRPSREMQFRVLGEEEKAAVEEQLTLLSDAGLDPQGDGAFLATVVYREAGLFYEAANSLAFLEDSGITLGADAYLLKAEIMDALGDLDAAQKAFDQADGIVR